MTERNTLERLEMFADHGAPNMAEAQEAMDDARLTIARLERDLASARAEVVSLTRHNAGLLVIEAQKDAEIERLRLSLCDRYLETTRLKSDLEQEQVNLFGPSSH